MWLIELKLDALGVLEPLVSPESAPKLFLNRLFLEVWGWGLKENSIGELLNNFGKLESFMKLIVILAIELDEDIGLEFIELARERVLRVVDSVNLL